MASLYFLTSIRADASVRGSPSCCPPAYTPGAQRRTKSKTRIAAGRRMFKSSNTLTFKYRFEIFPQFRIYNRIRLKAVKFHSFDYRQLFSFSERFLSNGAIDNCIPDKEKNIQSS